MDFRITDEQTNRAVEHIENTQLTKELGDLYKKLNALKADGSTELPTTIFSDQEAKEFKNSINNIDMVCEGLKLKKQTYESSLKSSLNMFDIKQAVENKEKISEIDSQEAKLAQERESILNKIQLSNLDFEREVGELNDKFKNYDPFHDELPSDYNINSINEFKRQKACECVKSFLDTLTPEKYEQVLSENQDLKGYINVGESI